jgi:hypothetical protein
MLTLRPGGAGRARRWLDAVQAALDLYAGAPAVDYVGLPAEIANEIRLLRAIIAEAAAHAAERETRYRQIDPAQLAPHPARPGRRRRPGADRVHGNPARFAHGEQFRSFTA